MTSNLTRPQKAAIVKCRISAHKLPIEVGRFKKIHRTERLCLKCNLKEVGDEFYCLFECKDSKIVQSRNIMMERLRHKSLQVDLLPCRSLCLYLLNATDIDLLAPVADHILRSMGM